MPPKLDQLLLYSQPVGLGLLVEILTRGAKHPADILASARDFAFDAFEVWSLLHRANFFSGVPSNALPATPFISFNYIV